jgi:hypothetical protein
MALDLSAGLGKAVLVDNVVRDSPFPDEPLAFGGSSEDYSYSFVSNFTARDLPDYLDIIAQADIPPETIGILEQAEAYNEEEGYVFKVYGSHGLFCRNRALYERFVAPGIRAFVDQKYAWLNEWAKQGPKVPTLTLEQVLQQTLTKQRTRNADVKAFFRNAPRKAPLFQRPF